jgi:hypothetical protein
LRGNPGIDLLEAADEGLARMPPEFFGDEVFLPLTPRGPIALAATLAIIATRALMETISSDPTFSTSPHSERINRSETSRHSSI